MIFEYMPQPVPLDEKGTHEHHHTKILHNTLIVV